MKTKTILNYRKEKYIQTFMFKGFWIFLWFVWNMWRKLKYQVVGYNSSGATVTMTAR